MKMNKLIIIIMSFVLLNILTVSASATKIGKKDIPVTYSVSGNEKYKLNINVNGDGTVYNGNQSIRNGGVSFEIKVGESKTLVIIPDDYSSVKSINWKSDDVDLDEFYRIEKSNGQIKLDLEGLNRNSELNIEFEKANIPNKIPQTGDNGNVIAWILLFAISLSMLLVIKLKTSVK